MTISFIIILLGVVFVLLIFKRTKASFIVLLFTILCLVFIGNGTIPKLLLTPLQKPMLSPRSPLWKENNAIVLLGAGTYKVPGMHLALPALIAYSRINKTASLYLDCLREHERKCTVIISGGDPLKMHVTEAEVYRDFLLHLGINDRDIILEPNSLNTYQNAKFVSEIVKTNHYDQIVLVTSGIHLKRALLYFSHFGMAAIPVYSDYLTSKIVVFPSGFNFALTDFAIHEYLGMVQFHLYNFLGLNNRTLSKN